MQLVRSALAVSVFALLPACADVLGDGGSRSRVGEPPDEEVLGALEQALVDAHNVARARAEPAPDPALPEVAWDPAIAAVAQAWAEGCVFEHSEGSGYGENLALFSPREIDAELATGVVELWESETADYSYSSNSCAPGAQCGHYTQVVWRDTTRIGCGVADCGTVDGFGPGNIWVCNYDPPGNFIGERPY